MKDKRTNVGYGKGMASSGGSGGMRGGRSVSQTPKNSMNRGMKKFVKSEVKAGTKVINSLIRGSKGVNSITQREASQMGASTRSPKRGPLSYAKSPAKIKPSSSKMSSRYAGKMKAMGKKGK